MSSSVGTLPVGRNCLNLLFLVRMLGNRQLDHRSWTVGVQGDCGPVLWSWPYTDTWTKISLRWMEVHNLFRCPDATSRVFLLHLLTNMSLRVFHNLFNYNQTVSILKHRSAITKQSHISETTTLEHSCLPIGMLQCLLVIWAIHEPRSNILPNERPSKVAASL